MIRMLDIVSLASQRLIANVQCPLVADWCTGGSDVCFAHYNNAGYIGQISTKLDLSFTNGQVTYPLLLANTLLKS